MADAAMSAGAVPFVTPESTDDLVNLQCYHVRQLANLFQLHHFWEPMLLQDVFGPSQSNAIVSGHSASDP